MSREVRHHFTRRIATGWQPLLAMPQVLADWRALLGLTAGHSEAQFCTTQVPQ